MTATKMKEYPMLVAGELIPALLDGTKTETRRPVHWRNSSVLGYPAKKYWPRLRFQDAIARDDSLLMMAISGEHVPNRDVHLSVPFEHPGEENELSNDLAWYRVRPLIEVGDAIWVRETWMHGDGFYPDATWKNTYVEGKGWTWVDYRASCTAGELVELAESGEPWRPSIHMPRWACRIRLEVTGVSVSRIQDIDHRGCVAEGIHPLPLQDANDPSAWWESSPGKNQARTPIGSFAKLWDACYGKGAWERNEWAWIYQFRRLEQ